MTDHYLTVQEVAKGLKLSCRRCAIGATVGIAVYRVGRRVRIARPDRDAKWLSALSAIGEVAACRPLRTSGAATIA